MESERYHFSVGSIKCISIKDGGNIRPHSELIVGVDKAKLDATLRAEGVDPDKADQSYNVLFMQIDGVNVLIDAGNGAEGRLIQHLEAEGISPAEIDRVIVTHTDGDHIVGLLGADGSLTFPNADVVLSDAAWEWWTSEPALARLPAERAAMMQRIAESVTDRLTTVASDAEIMPGVRAVPTSGHREGMIGLLIESEGEKLLHVADAISNPAFFQHPDWHNIYDSDPLAAVETRKRLMAQAASEGALVYGYHIGHPGLGRVTAAAENWVWEAVGK